MNPCYGWAECTKVLWFHLHLLQHKEHIVLKRHYLMMVYHLKMFSVGVTDDRMIVDIVE